MKAVTHNCVIYTRVSTKEQADNNMSLETQKKACEQYAARQGYRTLGCFGGTYESAKTDERKQFNAMLAFVRKSKEQVSAIIVYSVDRFSRSGGNAIYITEQLKKQGIVVCAVTQPTDATTASGSLQQNIQFIFSEYDNQLRREKCMAGMKEKLLSGGWIGRLPFGYDIVQRDGKKEIVLNAKGKLISKAFGWRAQGMSNEEVRLKLVAAGWNLPNQRVSDMLRNPFYCGLIAHKALEGKVIEGNQEKAVSKELFLQVNGLLTKNAYGYSLKPENDEIPLKKFVRCAGCGKPLTGYKAKKNQQFYYKCSTVGCNCNRRATHMHERFRTLLAPYHIKTEGIMPEMIERQMIETYHKLNTEKAAAKEELHRRITEVSKKMERLEERYILEEINPEMFAKYNEKFLAERKELETELAKTGNTLSNLKSCVKRCFEYATNLAPLWDSGDYGGKQRLQNLLFPEGIVYERKKDSYRTGRVNSVFSYMASLARVLGQKKSGETDLNINFPAWVETQGIDLAASYQRSLAKNTWVNLRGTLTYATSKQKVLDEIQYPAGIAYLSRAGYSISQAWGLVAERLFIDQKEVANSPVQFGDNGLLAGDIKYKDINGDGIINNDDMVPIGYPQQPEVIYGFGASMGHKRFDFSFYFQGSARSSFFINPANMQPFYLNGGYQNNLLQVIADNHWSEENRNLYAFWPRLSTWRVNANNVTSTWWMRNGNFLRLKSVDMGYTFPDIKKLHIKGPRLYLSATNLFVISSFKLWDVEMGGNGLNYPVQSVYSIGAQLNF